MTDKTLVERLRSSAQAFRDHPIYTADGDPVLLTVQADELDQAADRITQLEAENERLRAKAEMAHDIILADASRMERLLQDESVCALMDVADDIRAALNPEVKP